MSAGDIDLSTVSATAGAKPAPKPATFADDYEPTPPAKTRKHKSVAPQDLDPGDLTAEAALAVEKGPVLEAADDRALEALLAEDAPEHVLDSSKGWPKPEGVPPFAVANRPAAVLIPTGVSSRLAAALERGAPTSPEKADRLRRLETVARGGVDVKAEPRSPVDAALDCLTDDLNLLVGAVDALEIKLEPVRTPSAPAQSEDPAEDAPASPLALRIRRLARSLQLEVRRLQRLHRDLEL